MSHSTATITFEQVSSGQLHLAQKGDYLELYLQHRASLGRNLRALGLDNDKRQFETFKALWKLFESRCPEEEFPVERRDTGEMIIHLRPQSPQLLQFAPHAKFQNEWQWDQTVPNPRAKRRD